MPDRIAIARAYFDGFAANDHAAILALLTDDVAWEIHGHRFLRGKADFGAEIDNEAFETSPTLTIDRVIDAGDTVAVPHHGETKTKDGKPFRFAACDILTFREELIERVDSWVVPLAPQ